MAITYNNLYMDIRQKLHRAGIDAATLEARELVAFAAGKTRQELLRDGGLYVSQEVEQRAAALAERHLAGEPLAYLIGEWSFCGMDLDIDENVLIPRTDTEVLAEQAIKQALADYYRRNGIDPTPLVGELPDPEACHVH